MWTRRALAQTGLSAALGFAQGSVPARSKITSSVLLWTLPGDTFEHKVEIAAKAGMQSIGLVDEHEGWSDAQLAAKKKFVRSFDLQIDTLSATSTKSPVSMVDSGVRDRFLARVQTAIRAAQKLETTHIAVISGNVVPGRSNAEQYASLVESAKRAAELAAKADITLIVEPLNAKVDHKSCFLTTCAEALRLIKDVDHPRCKLLFDMYHEQVQSGDISRTLAAAAPYTAVFHIADNPGRRDPGTGEINFPHVYKAIQQTGFAGNIAMEYLPTGDAVSSLKKSVDEMRANLS